MQIFLTVLSHNEDNIINQNSGINAVLLNVGVLSVRRLMHTLNPKPVWIRYVKVTFFSYLHLTGRIRLR